MNNMLQQVNYCIDDKVALEIAHVRIYTKSWKEGFAVSMFEYCPRCKQYCSDDRMEKDLSKVVVQWLKHNNYNPEEFIRAERLTSK